MTHYYVIQTGTDMMSMVSNVGFPIAAFLLMYRLATQTIKENTRAVQDLVKMIEGQNQE